MAAPDKPNNLAFAAGILVTAGVLFAMAIGCRELFIQVTKQERDRKVTAYVDPRLKAGNDAEFARLNAYQWVDQGKGVVRIPTKRAAELVLRDWDKRPTAPVPMPPPAAAAAPAPAEAPKADAPKADAPKADAPKADAAKADAPKADAPKADAPANP